MIEVLGLVALCLILLPALAGYCCLAGLCLLALPAASRDGLFVPRKVRAEQRHRNPRRHRQVPARLARRIHAADRRCVVSRDHRGPVQIDHFMPYAHGGLMVCWNLLGLCQRCNLVKSDFWRWPSGDYSYHAGPDHWDPAEAEAIVAAERRARWRPLRWLRMALA